MITDEKDFELARLYYPSVSSEYVPDIDRRFQELSDRFDVLFSPQYWAPHLKQLFSDLYKKQMLLVHCAHGQSDKGYAFPLLHAYATQDLALVYGNLLKTMLHELGVYPNLVLTGNYRLSFYLRYKNFYDAIAEKKVFSQLLPNKKNLLYAPTWKDADASTSFFQMAPLLFSEIPDNWNVLLKLHPLLEQKNPAQFYRISELLSQNPKVLMISEFPPIYPLLSRSDAYLGDYSSVGYDFLFFKRPMFFLPTPGIPSGRLLSCGITLESPKTLFSEIEKEHQFAQDQAALYSQAFGKIEDDEIIRKRILSRCEEAIQTAYLSH